MFQASVARHKARKLLSAAAPVVAGVLAGLLLLLGLLAANDGLHRRYLHRGQDGANLCLACLLLKGQVKSSDPAPVAAAFVALLLYPAPRADTAVLPDVSYLASPSRAPPASALLPRS